MSHPCNVCKVVNISSEKTKIRCVQCNEDLSECVKMTNMNLEQFTKRQLERIEILKLLPNEIQRMQKREDES